jgi:SAM-dependent methyltransferase
MFELLKKPWKVNSSRKYLADFARRAAGSIPDGSLVLDAGAGDSPYKAYFIRKRYHATDLGVVEKGYGQLSFICDLKEIPISRDCYDLVFCSQTLEHVPDPKMVISELERVLKPGGHLWLTAPLNYEEHEVPYDYYRYTQFGLKYILLEAGFQIELIEWLEGYFGAVAYQLKVAARALPMAPKELGFGNIGWLLVFPLGGIKILFAILSLFFTWLDLRAKFISRGYCKNYAVIAVKLYKDPK